MAAIQVETQPSVEPVTLDVAKKHMRVTITDDDDLIGMYLQAARESVETFLARSLVNKGYRQSLDSFPYFTDTMMSQMAYPPAYYSLPRYSTTLWNYSQMIKLFYSPLVQVLKLSYLSSGDGLWHDLYPTPPLWRPSYPYTIGSRIMDPNGNLQVVTAANGVGQLGEASASIALAPSAPGDFTIAHGLGAVPTLAIIQMTSSGAIWLQPTTQYDATNLYLAASDAGVTGIALVWRSPLSTTSTPYSGANPPAHWATKGDSSPLTVDGDLTWTYQGPAWAGFIVDPDSEPPRIFPLPGQYWPSVLYVPNAVQIHYVSGYGNDGTNVPGLAKVGILQTVASWYENRESVSPDSMKEVPGNVADFLWNLRVLDFAATRG